MTTSFVMYVVAYSKALKEVRLNKQRAESENAVAQREENAEQDESEGENVGQAAVGREEWAQKAFLLFVKKVWRKIRLNRAQNDWQRREKAL